MHHRNRRKCCELTGKLLLFKPACVRPAIQGGRPMYRGAKNKFTGNFSDYMANEPLLVAPRKDLQRLKKNGKPRPT